jgi:hypothetical protein
MEHVGHDVACPISPQDSTGQSITFKGWILLINLNIKAL